MRQGEYVAMRRKGFTLIELLVVVAIIVILAGILYPVFAATRRAAYNAACLSNLKQIGLAVSMYTQDYDESFPTACAQIDRIIDKAQPADWPQSQTPYLWDVVKPYVKNPGLWHCPGDVGFTANRGAIKFLPSAYLLTGSSYTYNTDLAWHDPDPALNEQVGYWAPLTVGAIQQPSETFVAAEPAGHWHNSILSPLQSTPDTDTTSTYHQNQVCVDGHSKSFTRAQIRVLWSRDRTEF
jgi:prepilin-type N-terminal cleavage/methylation domain-containing protein